MNTIQKFTSKVDGCTFDYFIAESTNTTLSHYKILSFRVEGTADWQDFIPNSREYSTEQHQEMMNLLEGN